MITNIEVKVCCAVREQALKETAGRGESEEIKTPLFLQKGNQKEGTERFTNVLERSENPNKFDDQRKGNRKKGEVIPSSEGRILDFW